MRLLLLATVVAQVLGATKSATCSPSKPTSTPIAPRQDPWYTAPKGFEAHEPGTVLRIRPAPGNLTTITGANCSATYNVLYRTTDSQFRPAWAVTTVFVPKTPSTDNNALLAYQIAYDAADVDASPSYALYQHVQDDIPRSLAKGWFVTVPDYEGPLASFTAGVISGYATIDAIRATLALGDLAGLSLGEETRYAMWGYSGGALASEWAAELAVQYAPEMRDRFVGAALGGLTPNVSSVMLSISGGYAAGLAPNAILGLTSQFPKVQEYVISRLHPTGEHNATTFLSAWNNTLGESIQTFFGQDLSKYFIGGFADLLEHPATKKIIYSDGIMGYHGVPQMPLFVYKAYGDLISRIEDTDKLVERFCEMGADIEYIKNTVGGHSADSTNGQASAEAFLEGVFNGTIVAGKGCSVRNVTHDLVTAPMRKRGEDSEPVTGEGFAELLLPGWH